MYIYTGDVLAAIQESNPELVGVGSISVEAVVAAVNKVIERREDYERNQLKVNGWAGKGTRSSAWATWTASMHFDGPGDDEVLHDIMKEHGPEVDYDMAEAVEEYLVPYITGEEWGSAYKDLSDLARSYLDGAIEEISWYELCENWIEEIEFEEEEDDDYIDPSDGMFVDADGNEGRLPDEEIREERKSSIDYADVEALGGWDAYFALRDKFKPNTNKDL